ncbi:MAG: hypothetical protein AAGD96_32520, partial [Chloroflexota bacterium]
MIEQEKPSLTPFRSLKETLLTNSNPAQLWINPDQLSLLKSSAKKLSAILIVLLFFNLGVYSFLGRQESESKFIGTYASEFNEFFEEDWFRINGNWEVKDGVLIQNDYVASNAAIAISLKANPQDTITMSADVILGDRGEGGGIHFNMWSPEQVARSHRVAILRQGESLFIDGGYFDDTLQFVQQFKLPITDLVDENN